MSVDDIGNYYFPNWNTPFVTGLLTEEKKMVDFSQG